MKLQKNRIKKREKERREREKAKEDENNKTPLTKGAGRPGDKKISSLLRSMRQLRSPNSNSDYGNRSNINNNSPNINNNQNDEDDQKSQVSDTTTENESDAASEISLIEKDKETKKPRNYAAQSFFIDKNPQNENTQIIPNEYKYSGRKVPVKLRGDFASLIENNPAILREKNPRIQVLNSTCQLDQIIDDENDEMNPEEIEDEIDKLKTGKNNNNPENNKILNRVVKNCDRDVYPKKKMTDHKKNWYSMSIPLDDKNNGNKWKFLNGIKIEKDKDSNNNKFELIQKDNEIPAKTPQKPYVTEMSPGNRSEPINNGNRYQTQYAPPYGFREMNSSQYYRSPIRSPGSSSANINNNFNNNYNSSSNYNNGSNRIPPRNYIESGNNNYNNRGVNNRSRNNMGNNINNNLSNNSNLNRSRGGYNNDLNHRSTDYDNGIQNLGPNGREDVYYPNDYDNNYDDYDYEGNKRKLFQ